MSDLAELPKGWQRVRLGNVASLRKIQIKPSKGDATPYIGLEHIVTGGSLKGLGKAGEAISNKTVFQSGDSLYGKLRPNLRKVLRAAFDGVCSTEILAVFAHDPRHGGFLSHLMRSDLLHVHAMRGITGTRMPRTSWSHLRDFRLCLPPMNEQREIAGILDAVDNAIDRTEAVKSATKRLCDALLGELLTRGVPGWHSKWRCIAGLGTIPAKWSVMPLGNFATLQRGADLAVQDRGSGSIPVYGSNGVLGTHAQPLCSGPGVITGRSGSIGRVYFADRPYWPLNTTLYVRDFHGNNERFTYWLLTSLRLDRYAASTGVPSLNRNFVHPKAIAVPSRDEQDTIATLLDAVEKTMRQHDLHRDALVSLKALTTHDLLTGRTRAHKLLGAL